MNTCTWVNIRRLHDFRTDCGRIFNPGTDDLLSAGYRFCPYCGGMIKSLLTGYRYLHCDNCNLDWREPSRDATSPSHGYCKQCSCAAYPTGYDIDPTIPTDDLGNLL